MVRFSNFTSTEMAAKYVRETFRWPLRETSAQRLRPFPEDHLILCPSFDLGMATRYAQDSNIPRWCKRSSTPWPWTRLWSEVVPTLKRTAFEKQYLLPVGYTFIILEADATVNESPAKCIAVYRVALNYGIRFPLYPVIEEILDKYELAPTQVVPTSWHNICSFIATCELHSLTYSARVFSLVHAIQRASKETGDLGWYCFNNRQGFMTAIKKKSKVKHWKYDFLFVHRESEQARARLTVFETGDATPEQVAADAERCREEERQRLINQQAKKAPPLVLRGKKPTISLPVRKRPRTEGRSDETAASAPTCPGEAGAEWSAPRHSGSWSTRDRTPEHTAPSKTVGTASQVGGGSPPSAHQPSTNFINADPTAKFSLVQDLVKSWDLATLDTSDSPKITEEELKDALAKAKVEATAGAERVAQAKEQGYQQDRADTLGYLHMVLVTLAQEFQEDSYFEAYLHYIDERQRAEDEGRDPEEVQFIPPFGEGEGEGAGDEATNPLDAEPGASEEEGHEDSGEPDV
ncbi:LOW QUALITY PROTEIN: hypothetical protein Cgig2_029996 [Carnegiea gigantea]|uniref:Uncharacterized protein n=1 Tax=Carnegiea gigantea TaxID=171969 RepID=A0A9Q1QEU2_9CARY|nr:LOW QUALITY PROTEIN: hypothetical protein Cgig2_029996 [Carnegiea gigantea]